MCAAGFVEFALREIEFPNAGEVGRCSALRGVRGGQEDRKKNWQQPTNPNPCALHRPDDSGKRPESPD